jgi:hypothetical protein
MPEYTLFSETTLLPRPAATDLGAAIGHCVMGRIVHLSPSGRPSVDFPGNDRAPLEARTLVEPPAGTTREDLENAEVLLVFENEDPRLPLIVGFPRSGFRTLVMPAGEQATTTLSASGTPVERLPAAHGAVEVDGRRVEIKGDKEIRLSCGRSSITLRQDGKIVIKGTHIVSRSEGPHRIKGGSVTIN